MVSAQKTRQSAKIKEIANALVNVGYLTLDEQARVLGLCRSTTWTLVKTSHKGSGLSAGLVNRMLASSQLPAPVREKVIEYVQERLAGLHGHSASQCRKFAARLTIKLRPTASDLIREIYNKGRPPELNE
jgi:hypothetical protein